MFENEMTREELKYKFLSSFFEATDFETSPLAADASFRRYERVTVKGYSFILMDSPREHYNLYPFIKINQILSRKKFSVPILFYTDIMNGFVLLEDFGSTSFSKHLLEVKSPGEKLEVYRSIIELLGKLHMSKPPRGLLVYSNKILLNELELFTEWYIPYIKGEPLDNLKKSEFINIWREILAQLPKIKPCLIHRDFHVENLMLLDRPGHNSIGILDFQDALIGCPLYDVVSLLEDARIQVDKDFASNCLDYYLTLNSGIDKKEAYLSYHILGAQRNSRIVGVFARKFLRDGEESYLNYIPRVLDYLQNDLNHPVMSPLKSWLDKNL